MLKLCGFRISNYHNKVRLVLLERDIAFEEDDSCAPKQTDEYLARSPMGKVPFLELDGGRRLSESAVICEYLEDRYPQNPLLPADPFERSKVRELLAHLELDLELVARRLYGQVFFKRGNLSAENIQAVERDLLRGVRAFRQLARFDPYIAGKELTLADCAAFVHLPLVSLSSKLAFGRDFLDDIPAVKPYLRMLGERPAFHRVNEDRKAASQKK
jgi:glutathione S-transferase